MTGGVVGEHGQPVPVGGAGGEGAGGGAGHQEVGVAGVGGVGAVVVPEGEVAAGERGRVGAGVDVVPGAGAGLAADGEVGAAGEDIAAVAGQVRPAGPPVAGGAPQGAGPADAVDGEGGGAVLPQRPVVDDGLGGHAVAGGDARAQADHAVPQEEPGLPGDQRGGRPAQVLSHGGPFPVGGAAHPACGGLGLAPAAALVVGQALGGDGGAGQPIGVDGGPEGIGVLVAAEVGAPPVEHSGAGVPAARVLAVAVLVVGDPVGGHGQARGPAGAAVHRAVHGGKKAVADGFRGGGRGAVGDGGEAGEVGDRVLPVGQDGQSAVPVDPALDHAVPALALRGARGRGEQGDGGDQRMAVEVVAAHHPSLVATQITAADGAAVDAVHHQSVEEQRRIGVLHAVEDGLPGGVGDRPRRAVQECEEPAQAVEQDGAVGAGVGDPGVLEEGAVGVEAVAPGDVREDGAQGVAGEGDLCGGAAEDAAQGDDAAQVDAIGAGAGAGVVAEHGVGDEVVDGGEVALAPGAGEPGVDERDGVQQQFRGADLPFPPVAVPVGGRVVDGGVEVVEAGEDVGGEFRVAGVSGAGLGDGLGHGVQPSVAAGDAGRRVVGAVRPEGGAGGAHGRTEGGGEGAGLTEGGGVRRGLGVEAGAEGEVAPAGQEGGAGVLGGRGARREREAQRARGGGGEKSPAGPGGGGGDGRLGRGHGGSSPGRHRCQPGCGAGHLGPCLM